MTPQTEQSADKQSTEQPDPTANAAAQQQAQTDPTATNATLPKPSICRAVVFTDHNGLEWPGIVQAVNADGTVDLAVFRAQHYLQAQRIAEAAPGTRNSWSWPARS